MQVYEVLESDKFKSDLEEAAFWLYSHNLEQSEEFADRKFAELEQEISGLKKHLSNNPRMGQADEISGMRRFPIYGGRFVVTWAINEVAVTLFRCFKA
jgi:plasmid stabilization system protein ParE